MCCPRCVDQRVENHHYSCRVVGGEEGCRVCGGILWRVGGGRRSWGVGTDEIGVNPLQNPDQQWWKWVTSIIVLDPLVVLNPLSVEDHKHTSRRQRKTTKYITGRKNQTIPCPPPNPHTTSIRKINLSSTTCLLFLTNFTKNTIKSKENNKTHSNKSQEGHPPRPPRCPRPVPVDFTFLHSY